MKPLAYFPPTLIFILLFGQTRSFLFKASSRERFMASPDTRSGNFYSELLLQKKSLDSKGVGKVAYDIVSGVADMLAPVSITLDAKGESRPVRIALQKIQKDMRILDEAAGNTAQLSTLELVLLLSTVLISASSPLVFSTKVVELLVPSMAAVSAAVGISAGFPMHIRLIALNNLSVA